MPTRFSAHGRVFKPAWFMTLLTAVLLVAFVMLGRWQWHRGAAKEAVWEEYQRDSAAVRIDGRSIDSVERFSHAEVRGHFDGAHQVLLDNISHAGQPGYEVLTPFLLADGSRVLVNRGWVPFTGYRTRLPDIALSDSTTQPITGRIADLPSPGLASGRAPPTADSSWPKLTSFPTHAELEGALGAKIAQRILLLDPKMPDGYVREWTPPGLPPDRHFSYAIQWWGFAVVLLVLYFGLNFRKVS
jgi:cytochrome oxidase assembly protein ShyY1